MKPRISILNPEFKYRKSHQTNVGLTIKREYARLKALADAKVIPINGKVKK